MAPGSCTTQWSPCFNLPANIPREQDKLDGARSDVGSDKAPTPLKAPIPPLVPSPAKDLLTKFMQVFMETTYAQALAELRDLPLKTKTPNTSWGKSYIDTTTSISCVRTILKHQVLPRSIVPRLQLHSFVTSSALGGLNTSVATKAPLPSRSQSSKSSFKRISEVPRSSLTVSGVSLGGTPNTN